jgi:hypothetical protein
MSSSTSNAKATTTGAAKQKDKKKLSKGTWAHVKNYVSECLKEIKGVYQQRRLYALHPNVVADWRIPYVECKEQDGAVVLRDDEVKRAKLNSMDEDDLSVEVRFFMPAINVPTPKLKMKHIGRSDEHSKLYECGDGSKYYMLRTNEDVEREWDEADFIIQQSSVYGYRYVGRLTNFVRLKEETQAPVKPVLNMAISGYSLTESEMENVDSAVKPTPRSQANHFFDALGLGAKNNMPPPPEKLKPLNEKEYAVYKNAHEHAEKAQQLDVPASLIGHFKNTEGLYDFYLTLKKRYDEVGVEKEVFNRLAISGENEEDDEGKEVLTPQRSYKDRHMTQKINETYQKVFETPDAPDKFEESSTDEFIVHDSQCAGDEWDDEIEEESRLSPEDLASYIQKFGDDKSKYQWLFRFYKAMNKDDVEYFYAAHADNFECKPNKKGRYLTIGCTEMPIDYAKKAESKRKHPHVKFTLESLTEKRLVGEWKKDLKWLDDLQNLQSQFEDKADELRRNIEEAHDLYCEFIAQCDKKCKAPAKRKHGPQDFQNQLLQILSETLKTKMVKPEDEDEREVKRQKTSSSSSRPQRKKNSSGRTEHQDNIYEKAQIFYGDKVNEWLGEIYTDSARFGLLTEIVTYGQAYEKYLSPKTKSTRKQYLDRFKQMFLTFASRGKAISVKKLVGKNIRKSFKVGTPDYNMIGNFQQFWKVRDLYMKE